MRRGWLAAAVLLPLALAACGDDTPPPAPQSFAPLHYDYLPKLRLNVGQVSVQDHSLPVGPQDVAASSPAVPAQALAQMARDRLFAAGTEGVANFVIDQASIVRGPGGALDGQLAVHLDLVTAGGARAGYAEARIARQHVPGSDPEDQSANLYELTRQMMDGMNVELEYQMRRSLRAFMLSGAAVPAPVTAQPLGTPGAPPIPAAVAVPPPPALPPAVPEGMRAPTPLDGYQDPAEPPPPPSPPQMSPPPGYLQPPPGAVPLPMPPSPDDGY